MISTIILRAGLFYHLQVAETQIKKEEEEAEQQMAKQMKKFKVDHQYIHGTQCSSWAGEIYKSQTEQNFCHALIISNEGIPFFCVSERGLCKLYQ